MADVFISYSRKDSDFVAKLAAALKTAGRDVWVDVEGIRASEDWKQKIFREIDRANTFLFVVSPDSLKSEIANEEVSHAALNSKRMISLFYRGLHDGTIPPALGRFQGIQFSDDALFPSGVSELLKTLATDIELMRAEIQNTMASGESATTHLSGLMYNALPKAVSIVPFGSWPTAEAGSLVTAHEKIA